MGVEGLPFGDYCVEHNGDRLPVCFERKSINDLFGTMGKGYKRFKKEIMKAKEAKYIFILIIEGSLLDVWAGCNYSYLKGSSVVKKLFTLWARYDVIPVFCEDRRTCSKFVEETFYALDREWRK